MGRRPTERELAGMACLQLSRMIREGKWEEEAREEWRRRWRLEWPLRLSSSGIKADD